MNYFLADTITEFLDRDLTEESRRSYYEDLLRPGTFLSYAGNRPVADFTPRDIDLYRIYVETFISERTKKRYAPATVRKRMTAVKALFQMCVDRGYIEENPAASVRVSHIPPAVLKKAMPVEDLKKMLRALSDQLAGGEKISRQPERDLFIVTAFADRGLRRGDLAKLTIGEVDTHDLTMILHRKGRKQQTLSISDDFVAAFNRWLAVRPETDHYFVLCTMNHPDRPKMSPPGISQTFRRIAKAATGKSYGPHAARHTWAYEALKKHVPLTVVQNVLGHASPKLLLEVYAVANLDDQREALNTMSLAINAVTVDPEPTVTESQENGAVVLTVDLDSAWGVFED